MVAEFRGGEYSMTDEEKKKRQVDLLLEEWKENVDLYIDQDKRGFARIQMFLAVQGALLVIFQFINSDLIKVVLGLFAIFMTVITLLMSRRAHNYIRLRIVQGMLIEEALKDLTETKDEWRSSSGIITTFSREHAVFSSEPEKVEVEDGNKNTIKMLTNKWRSLRGEIKEKLGSYPGRPFFDTDKTCSLGHLKWLELMFWGLCFLWGIIVVYVLAQWWCKCVFELAERCHDVNLGTPYIFLFTGGWEALRQAQYKQAPRFGLKDRACYSAK